MPIRVKTNITIKKQLQDARSKSSKQIKRGIRREILKDYAKGISPVKGFNRFRQYAPSTAKKKGRKTPVNVRDTGQLWKSLSVVQKASNVLTIFFKGKRNADIASFLTFGTKNMDARPLLPTFPGSEFKKRIADNVTKIVEKAFSKIK